MDYSDLVRNAHMAADTGSYGGTKKKIFAAAAMCTLCLYINQAHSAQTEAEAVEALCDAMRYQAYNTMELRQLSTPKYKLKDMVDQVITNVNSRMTQYKLIDEAYMLELAKPERADLVAHEFAESQRARCMSERNI